MLVLWVTGAVLAIVLAWVIFTFNRLVRTRNRVDSAWSQIDVELQRRYELVPQLSAAVGGYAAHEEAVFTRVAETRARAVDAATPDDQSRADTELTDALRSLFFVSEAYPALKSSEQFEALQDQLAHTEDRIAYARGYYNALVVSYETQRQSLPSKLVASTFRFPRRPLFEAEVASRSPVTVDLRGSDGRNAATGSDPAPGPPQPARGRLRPDRPRASRLRRRREE